MFLERLRRILSEDRPQLGRYRAEDDPESTKWVALPIGEVLARLRSLRGKLIEMVGSLSPEQLGRTGVHPVLGEMAVPMWIEFFLLHEAHHLYVALVRSRGGG